MSRTAPINERAAPTSTAVARDRCPAHRQVPPSYYIPAAGTPMRILACRRCATYAEQQAAPSGDVSPACDRHAACGLRRGLIVAAFVFRRLSQSNHTAAGRCGMRMST